MQNLREEWGRLWRRLRARGDSQRIYDDLAARYFESHRVYHTLKHIGHCLDEFEQVQDLVVNPDAVSLAIWYHDAVYDTKAKDNEEKSAALVLGMMKEASLIGGFRRPVVNLILASKHSESPTSPDAQLFVDIDLSILGQSKERFDEYEQQIRKEYGWVAEDAFHAGRSAILKSFFDRPAIYSTQFFRNKYEAQARRNIRPSL